MSNGEERRQPDVRGTTVEQNEWTSGYITGYVRVVMNVLVIRGPSTLGIAPVSEVERGRVGNDVVQWHKKGRRGHDDQQRVEVAAASFFASVYSKELQQTISTKAGAGDG